MGIVITYFGGTVYNYYNKITGLCSRKKNTNSHNESLLNGSLNYEDIFEALRSQSNFTPKDNIIKLNQSTNLKSEYKLLKNDDSDNKLNFHEIDSLNKELEQDLIDIKYDLKDDSNNLNNQDYNIDDLKNAIFIKNVD